MIKKIVLIGLSLLFVGTLAILGLGYWLNTPPGDFSQGEARDFVVEKGENLGTIASRLEKEGLIRSALLLELYSRLDGTGNRFQSGPYKIPAGTSTLEIHGYLTSGKQVLLTVAIPEGLTARQIARIFEERGVCTADEFLAAVGDPKVPESAGMPWLDSAEGFLFPDTYLFQAGTPAVDAVIYMLKNFQARVGSLDKVPLAGQALQEGVILASIIEKEYVDPQEAPLIASVFHNRLAMGKGLESCATVVWIMTEELGLPHPSRIFYQDLQRPSPYNTYLHRGLPPGPICNPGLVALNASFHPAQTDYLYFVLKGSDAQRHHFSKNFAEHTQASVFYLKQS